MVVAWVVAIGVLTVLAPTLDSVKTSDDGNPPADSMSMRAAALAEKQFGAEGAPPAVIVVRSQSRADTRMAVSRMLDEIEGADLSNLTGVVDSSRAAELVTGNGTAEMILVGLDGAPSSEDYRGTVTDLREIASEVATDDVEVAVTGPAGIVVDAVEVFGGGDRVLLLGTVILVVVLLLVIYRSLVLVAVSLLGVGFAMRLAEGVGALLADAGLMQISGQTSSIMTVLLFGVGTDYALIVFARFREAVDDSPEACPDATVAVAVAMRSVAGALVASVSTVVGAVLALLVAVTPTLHDFGPYLALGVASMAAVAFTLTPALLVVCGRLLVRPRRSSSTRVSGSRLWWRVSGLVDAAPRRVLAGGLAALALMGTGLIGVQQSFDLVSGFRIETESAAGQEMLAESFGPGAIAPSQVLLDAEAPPRRQQIETVLRALGETDGVARVGVPRSSPDGRTVAVDVVLDDNPFGPEAMALVPDLVRTAGDAARAAGVEGPVALVGGETSVAADTRAALDRDLPVVGALMLLVVATILGLVLRSLLAPLYIAATLVLSYGATMGLTAFLALTVGGDAGIGNRVAVYVLVFLIALGVDYTIFMLSRYRQELAHHPPRQALRTSIERTGGVISSAGLILAGTFAVLMTQPIRELYQFGLAMAIGILLDTFVVRPLLVPAFIRLLDHRALWPSRPIHR